MAVFETWLKSDLKKPLKVVQLEGNLFSADNGGNLIGVEVMNNGQAASLSGGVTGYIIRADGETVIITGTLSGNKASIVLPASAYVVVGQISIVIKVGSTTVGACVGYVYRTTTDAIVDPGHVIPSLAELLAQIATMRELNQTVTAQESGRVSAESIRAYEENQRAAAETARASAETARASAETARAAAETARASVETARDTAETGRATAETGRVNAESGRVAAETARDTAETARGTAEAARASAETARATAESARDTAETARAAAETQRATDTAAAIAAAGTATSAANTAAGKIDNMTVEGQTGTTTSVTISEVNGHKHISFTVQKGDKGDPGKDFDIRKTFASIAAMQAYDPETDPSTKKVRENDFVMIDTGSVQDVDTGKLFCYEPTTQDVWRYIGDLSGSQGIKGETGTGIANITLNQDYTLTITMDDGNYYTTASIRGAQGPAGVSPTVTVTAVTGGHQVDVTDASGTQTFIVLDGVDGSDGADGADGTSAYCYIRYSHTQPNQDSDMGTTPDDWMGIYSGTSSTPPTTYTSYTWYKIKGETGSVQNVYATTIPMSDQDSTKISAAIAAKMDALNAAAPYDNTATYAEGAYCFHDGLKKCTTAITTAEEWTAAHWTSTTIAAELRGKVDANQGAGNAGKALGIDDQGNVVPVPFSGEDFTGATAQAAGTHGYVPAPAAGDQNKFLKGDGSWGTTPYPSNMGGATAQDAGTAGLVPAPAAGAQGKFLKGNGTWGDGLSPDDIVNNLTTDDATKALSAAMGKELNTKTASYEFTTEYSSLLAMINDQVTTKGKKLPFSFVKVGTAVLTDAPSACGGSEFSGIVYGNGPRLTVSIQAYGANPDNTRDIFRGNWLNQWYSVDQKIATTNNELASVENGLAYRETGTTASRNISDGEYVFWNGAMYKANGNIASGTTLISGTNLTPTENALNALNDNIAVQEYSDWRQVPIGLTQTFYYGAPGDATTYSLPVDTAYVVACRSFVSRGFAICKSWEYHDKRMWVCQLHDDSAPYEWTEWEELVLNSNIAWKFGGGVIGNTVLSLPTSHWKELWLRFQWHSDPKVSFSIIIPNNPNAECHYVATGYLSQQEIDAGGYTGFTPHLLWVDVYSYSQDLVMLQANSEDSIQNFAMNAFYR